MAPPGLLFALAAVGSTVLMLHFLKLLRSPDRDAAEGDHFIRKLDRRGRGGKPAAVGPVLRRHRRFRLPMR